MKKGIYTVSVLGCCPWEENLETLEEAEKSLKEAEGRGLINAVIVKSVTKERWDSAVEKKEGYCNLCHEFTTLGTEPDARGETCPECYQDAVVGLEKAMAVVKEVE